MINKIYIYLFVLFAALLGSIGQIFFKLSSKSFSIDFSLLTNWKLLIGLFLYGVATLILVSSLKYANLSILYPIIATSYIWVSLFSVLFLGESFPMFKWLGILLIAIGIIIVTK